MSSTTVRTAIKTFLTTYAPTEHVIDLTGQFAEIQNLISNAALTASDTWMGLQFIGNDEVPITVGSDNVHGKYRESGAIYFHIVDVAKLSAPSSILGRGETIISLFRGKRINDIIVESLTPINFDTGATLQFTGGYLSGSFLLSYTREYNI